MMGQLNRDLTSRRGYIGRSENKQYEWVKSVLRDKKEGVFVEVGAAHPLVISNTYQLEILDGWTGLCIEPCPIWHKFWEDTDRICKFSDKAVSTKTEKAFLHEKIFGSVLCDWDDYGVANRCKEKVEVECDTLENILLECEINHIDYLSVDIESANLAIEIIKGFDFKKHNLQCMTLEIAGHAEQKDISRYLAINGFVIEKRLGADIGYAKKWDQGVSGSIPDS